MILSYHAVPTEEEMFFIGRARCATLFSAERGEGASAADGFGKHAAVRT